MLKSFLFVVATTSSITFADTPTTDWEVSWEVSSPTVILVGPEPTESQLQDSLDSVKAQCTDFISSAYKAQGACKTSHFNPTMEFISNPDLPRYFRFTATCVVHMKAGCQ